MKPASSESLDCWYLKWLDVTRITALMMQREQLRISIRSEGITSRDPQIGNWRPDPSRLEISHRLFARR